MVLHWLQLSHASASKLISESGGFGFPVSLAGVFPFLKSIVESILCEVLGLIMGKMCHFQGKIRICK